VRGVLVGDRRDPPDCLTGYSRGGDVTKRGVGKRPRGIAGKTLPGRSERYTSS